MLSHSLEPETRDLMDIPQRGTVTPADFWHWRERDILLISPNFQRRPVWTLPMRSYLIDTLLRQMPVPPIYLRNVYDEEKEDVVHEVIDGQQRIRAVLDYMDDGYAVSTTLESVGAGKKFSKLPSAQRTAIRKYTFSCEIFHDITNQEVHQVFRRMNTYSVPLTAQELRHGSWFGLFSQACERLALDHNELWDEFGILSPGRIARMMDVQMTASLLIVTLDGMQDKNTSIGDYYRDYDETFPDRKNAEGRFHRTMEQLLESVGDVLADTQFRRPAHFYTLFCVTYHRMYGIRGEKLPTKKSKALSEQDKDNLRAAVMKLSDIIASAKEYQRLKRDLDSKPGAPPWPSKYQSFVNAALVQTDNIKPRKQRFETLYSEAFG
jgi:hypothetical protein